MTTFFEKIKKYRKGEEAANKIKRYRAGFTLAEVLIVVAIMAILAGFGFVAVSQYNKRLTQLEMDDTAKKIFLAAQNHLTIADTSGIWKQLVAECDSTSKSGNPNGPSLGGEFPIDKTTTYHVIYGKGNAGQSAGTDVGNQKNVSDVLNLILPVNSVNIGSDGSYAIIYNEKTATIYGVYYSAASTFGNDQDGLHFADVIPGIDRLDAKRRLEQAKEQGIPLIGYYGNAIGTAKESNTTLKALEKVRVWFTNEEDALTLHILDPNSISLDASDATNLNNLEVRITGDRSGTTAIYSVKKLETDESYTLFSSGDRKLTLERPDSDKGKADYTIVFDGLTGKHFKDLLPDFYPGEDITAQVTLTRSEKITGREIVTGSATDNSLYESIYPSVSGTADPTVDQGQYVARIENVRHLENLSSLISGIASKEAGTVAKSFSVRKAVLLENIDLTVARSGFTFTGILPDAALEEFDGNDKSIKGMNINVYPSGSKGNGLFAMIDRSDAQPGFAVKNLMMVNPNVKSTGANISAGALIGHFKGNSLSINNVNVNVDAQGKLADTIGEQSSVIIGQANAGGLVGLIDNSSACEAEILNCQVKRLRVISNNGNAGGFIGELTKSGVTDSGTLTIFQSKFTEPTANDPDGIDNTSDHYDIYAVGSAGGFIGTSGNKSNSTGWSVTVSDSEVSSEHRLNISGTDQVGGVIGGFYGDSLTIIKTLAAGNYMWTQIHNGKKGNDGSCVGGLIGESQSKRIAIENCGAGSYVYAKDADCAGGLIGSLKRANKSASIKNTYVSGHTNNGNYLEQLYDGTASTFGGYNVYGFTSTGGFIGYTNSNRLIVENCSTAASVFTDAGSSDKDTSNGIIGGFVGRTMVDKETGFKNCYVAGEIFKNDKNFDRCGGSFIGMIQNSGGSETKNIFENNAVLIGTIDGEKYNDDNISFAGSQTNYVTNAKVRLKGIKKVSASELKSKVKVVNIPDAENTAPFDDTLAGRPYPYPLNALLPGETEGSEQRRYVGDWVEPDEPSRTFDGDFGILYYEQVQDGDSADAPTHYYYHGYVGYETGSNKIKDQQYTEIFTRDTLNESQAPGVLDRGNKALPVEHGKYVVEQGYLILVRDELSNNDEKLNSIKVDLLYQSTKNSSARTLYELIHGTNGATRALYQEGDHYYSDKMNFTGFNCYYIKPDQDLSALYPGNNFTQLRFAQKDASGNYQWDNSATFAFNPMFSDISLMNSSSMNVDGTYTYKTRSAETLYNLFTTNYAMNDGWNSKLHMQMCLDISFRDTLKFQQFDITTGKPKNVTGDSDKITLSQLHFELDSDYYPDESSMKNMYSLDYLTAPLIGENVNGNLHDMHFIHYDPSDEIIKDHKTNDNANHTSAALLGICTNGSEIVKNIYIENTSGPVLDTAKGSIDNVVIDNISIYKNFGNQGIFCSGNEGTINHLTIKSIDVQETGAIGAVFETNGGIIGGTSDGGSSKSTVNIEQMIVSGKVNSQGVLMGSMTSGSAKPHHISLKNVTIKNGATVGNENKPSGIIGECFGGGKLHDFSMDSIKVEEGATIKGTYWGIIGSNQDEIYNFTLTGIDFSKIPLGDNIGIIGENGGNINTSSGQSITVSDYLTFGYGFVVKNSRNTIKNVTISDAVIGCSGFAKTNEAGATIDNCTVTTNAGHNNTVVNGNGFIETNHGTIQNCIVETASIFMNGFAGTNDGTISGCSLSNSTIKRNGFIGTNSATLSNNVISSCLIYNNGFAGVNDSKGNIKQGRVLNSMVVNNGFVGSNDGNINTNCIVQGTEITGGSGFVGTNNGTIGNEDYNNNSDTICGVIDSEISSTNSAGFVNNNKGTIKNIILKNVVSNQVGFAYVNAGTIEKSNIVNAIIGETGFVRENQKEGVIKYCQIHGDFNEYKKDNSKLKAKSLINEASLTNSVYELIQIGRKSDADTNYTSDASGFARNNDGEILYSSVTGALFGDDRASGFIHQQNGGKIVNSYANTIINSNGDGYGFCYSMKDDPSARLQNCFSIGEINASGMRSQDKQSKDRGSCGFIGSFSGKGLIDQCYSAEWSIVSPVFYNFVRNPGNISNCRYLVFNGAKESDVDYNGKTVGNLTRYTSKELKKVCYQWYIPSSIPTSQYNQRYSWKNLDGTEASYLYPQWYTWEFPLIIYGDWWEDGTLSEHTAGNIQNGYSKVASASAQSKKNNSMFSNNATAGSASSSSAEKNLQTNSDTSKIINETEGSTAENQQVYLTPAGVSDETLPDIVTKKQTVRKKAS